jgi:hypothetical protein
VFVRMIVRMLVAASNSTLLVHAPRFSGRVPIAVEKRNGVSSRWIGDHQP